MKKSFVATVFANFVAESELARYGDVSALQKPNALPVRGICLEPDNSHIRQRQRDSLLDIYFLPFGKKLVE